MVLVSDSFGLSVPLAATLLIPAMAALVQLKVIPEVELVGEYENTKPLQMAGGVAELVKTGLDITLTTMLKVVGFKHPLAVKV